MKNEMIQIINEMVTNGYVLFGETAEEFVDRIIGYGFDVKTVERWREKFLTYRN